MQNFHATGKYAQEKDSRLVSGTSAALFEVECGNFGNNKIITACGALINAKETPIPSSQLFVLEATLKIELMQTSLEYRNRVLLTLLILFNSHYRDLLLLMTQMLLCHDFQPVTAAKVNVFKFSFMWEEELPHVLFISFHLIHLVHFLFFCFLIHCVLLPFLSSFTSHTQRISSKRL